MSNSPGTPNVSLGSAEAFFEDFQKSQGVAVPSMSGANLGSADAFYEDFLKQQEAATPVDDRWEVTKGFAAGADQFQAMTGAFAAMLGDKLDSDTITEWGQDVLKSNLEEASQSPASVEGVENIGGIGDALDFAAYQIGNAIPSMGSAITGGLAGGFAGSLVAPGPGTAAGGIAGAFTPSYILSAGETYIDMIEAGVAKDKAVDAAFLTGIPMALLDVIEPTRVAGKVLWKPVKKEAVRSLRKRLAQDIPKGMATEGLTEGAQEAVKGASVAHMSEQDFLTSENLSQILNAMAAGGIVGGVTGGVSGAIPDRKAPETPPQGKPGVTAPAADQGVKVAEEQVASVVEEALSDPDEVPTVTTPTFTSTQVAGVPLGPRPGAAKAKVRSMWPDDMSAAEEYDPYQDRADRIDAVRPPDNFTSSEVSGVPFGPRRGAVPANSQRMPPPARFAASEVAPAPQDVSRPVAPAVKSQMPNNPALKFVDDVEAYIDAGGIPDPVNVSKTLRIPIPAANAALQIINNRPAPAPYPSAIDPTDEDIPFDPVTPLAPQDTTQTVTEAFDGGKRPTTIAPVAADGSPTGPRVNINYIKSDGTEAVTEPSRPEGDASPTIEPFTAKSFIVRGLTKEDGALFDGMKAKATWSPKGKGWVFSKKREKEVRDRLDERSSVSKTDTRASSEIETKNPEKKTENSAEDFLDGENSVSLPEADEVLKTKSGDEVMIMNDGTFRRIAPNGNMVAAGSIPEDFVGFNASGGMIRKDALGVRFVVDRKSNVRKTEPVAIAPGGASNFSTRDRSGTEYETIQESNERKAAEAQSKSVIDSVKERESQKEQSATVSVSDTVTQKPAYGATNKVFTQDAAEKARATLKAKLSGTQLNSGIDPEIIQAGITLAGYHIESGARSFAAYSKAMVDDLGEAVRPYLKSWYNAVRDYPGFDPQDMDSYDAVSKIDTSAGAMDRQQAPNGIPLHQWEGDDAVADATQAVKEVESAGHQLFSATEHPNAIAEHRFRAIVSTPGSEVSKRGYGATRAAAIRDALRLTVGTKATHPSGKLDKTPETEPDTIPESGTKENSGGVQKSLFDGDAGKGPGNAPGTSEIRPTGRPPAGEEQGSAPDVRGSDEGRGPSPERGGQKSGSRAKRRGNRESDADRIPGLDDTPQGTNYVYDEADLGINRSWPQKAIDNVGIIKLVKELETAGRSATADEQKLLVKYVGWGASAIKNVFRADIENVTSTALRQVAKDLKETLTPAEYDTARRSAQYAHYTAPEVISAMYDAARKLGFRGGLVFEPGMGIGHFNGMMPGDMAAKSRYNGLELDHMTARIARLLYPQSGVRQDDFRDAPLPKDYYDLVIGNPPFADIPVKRDANYPQDFLLHDYFFAKSLDAVRPGGLLMFVSSAGTMNKIDRKAREYLADKADLVGAIRLPGDAFEKNAGTKVTTDIVILRRRAEGEKSGPTDWVGTQNVTLPGKTKATVTGANSAYFIKNPDMVLGEEGFFDPLYENRYAVRARSGFDIKAELAKAVDRLPENIIGDAPGPTDRAEIDFGTTETKEGSYYLSGDKLMRVDNGIGVAVKGRAKGVKGGKSKDDVAKIRKLIDIRDGLRAVYVADLANDSKAGDKARQRLNKAYDDFVDAFGPINEVSFQYKRPTAVQQEKARAEARETARDRGEMWDEGSFDATPLYEQGKTNKEIAAERQAARDEAKESGRVFDEGTFDPEDMPDTVVEKRKNIDPFKEDPESYRLRSIEKFNDQTGEAQKGAIFFENILAREVEKKINSANDGVLWSLGKFGRLDMPAIAREVGKSESEVIEELGERVFLLPGTQSEYQTADDYLSGDVKRKLKAAEKAADRDGRFRRNVQALEAAQPDPLPPNEITMSLGMRWIPKDLVEAFATDRLGLGSIKVEYVEALSQYRVSGDKASAAATADFGTADMPAPDIIEAAMNRQQPKIVRRDKDGKSWVDTEATQAAQDKVKEVKIAFSDWIKSDDDRHNSLADLYNDKFNGIVPPKYDGSWLTTPGISSSWSWRPHQQRVVSRIIQAGNTYMAHAVGAGKTSAMIGAGMEMRRLGLARKPMYAVPKHMLGQFTKEFYEQYPTARIAVADEFRFDAKRRKQFIADVAQQDLDAVIITHTNLNMIPISSEFQDGIIQEELDIYRDALAEIKAGSEDGNTRFSVRKIENQIEKLEERLRSSQGAKKDQVFTFEELGVDHLMVDEAHMFRKLSFATTLNDAKGIDPNGSDKAMNLYLKARYLETINPGRSLVLASGTPVTNTMAELFTLQRFIQPQVLADRAMTRFDAWAANFGDTKAELESDPAGNYKSVTRFSQFVNAYDLYRMISLNMDIVTSSDLEQYVARPKLKGGSRELVQVERSPALEEYQKDLGRRMDDIAARKGPPEPGQDIILNVINDGRKAAIDMRLVGGSSDSNAPSKLDIMVDSVFDIWKRTKNQKFHNLNTGELVDQGPATQMVFSNLGVKEIEGFSTHKYIRAELIRRGVPEKEVVLIQSAKSHVDRQRLFNDMNEGKVRILIGTVAKMGTGVNAQKRLYAVHNEDALWFPADDEQRNGRIIRQGNMNPEIEIRDYATSGTYDATMWGMMARKARFIEQFFRGDPALREMEDIGEASHYEQARALSTADPRLIELTEKKEKLDTLRRQYSAFQSQQYRVRGQIDRAKRVLESRPGLIESTRKDIAQRKDTKGEAFVATVDGHSYDNRAEAGAAMVDILNDRADEHLNAARGTTKTFPMGEIGGFAIEGSVYRGPKDAVDSEINLVRNDGRSAHISYSGSAAGMVQSIERALQKFESEIEGYQTEIADAEKQAEQFSARSDGTFDKMSELETLEAEVNEIETALLKESEPEAKEQKAVLGDIPVDVATPPAEKQSRLPSDRRQAPESAAMDPNAAKRITDLVRSLVGDRVKVEASADGLTAMIDGKRRPIAGRYMNRLIEVSMNFGNPEVTVRHEVMHALKEMGVFTDQEWAVLERQARRVWSAKYGVDRTYADLSKAERTEEAIAQAFGEHRKGGKSPPGFRRIWEKVTAFLTRLSNLLRGMGFQTWQDVFARVESGRAGRRPENFNAAVRDNPRHMVGYHGSPHDHDGFSTDHIGSGEGAQAFGWGLYFAGKREVAEYYKSSVPFGSLKLSFLKELDPSSDAEEVIDLIDSGVFSPYQQRVLRALEADDWLGFDYPSQAISAAYSGKLDNWDASPELKDAVNSSGKLYTVDIPEDGDYLDWDAVLSDQSPSVREKLRDAFSGDSGALEMVRKNTPSDSESLTGREIYKALSRSLAAPIDEGGMNAWTSVQPVENDKAASEFLLSLGIPGIKYLDGMSRSMTGEGSRNYVIFDDSSVRILAKESRFGEPPDQDSGPKAVDDIGESIAAEAKSAGIERPGVLRSVSKFMSDWKKAPALPRKPDLNWFSKALVHPRTIAQMYPAFTKVWQAATGQFERRDVVNAELSRLWESYTRLSEKDKAQVNKVMEIGRIEGEVYGGKTITAKNISGAAQLTERGETVTLNEEQTKGYKAARLSMNRALEFFREEVLREWGYGEPGDPATYDEIMEHVKDLRADAKKAGPDGPEMMKEAGTAARLAEIIKEIEDAKRTGYVPFSRYGEYGIVVKDSLGTVVHFEKIEAGGMIGRQIARKKVHDIHEGLKSKYPTSEGYVVSDPRQIVTEKDVQGLGVKLSDLDGLASLVNLEGPEWESVREDLSDGMKKLGFRKHFINARNTAGYSTDFERSIADYITGISSYLARRRYADEFESALANIPIAQSGLRAYAKKYSEYIQSPQEEFQRLRNLGFFYYLSGNISSALVNLSQVPLATMPYLTQFASASAVTLETNRAYKDLAKMMKLSRDGGTIEFFDPNKAPADVRDDLKKAWDEGILVPLTTLEQMGMAHNRGKHLKGLSKQSRTVVEFAGSMFTGAERANRIATFIVAHRLARKQGFSERASKIMKSNALWRAEGAGSNPAAFATWTIDETHFRMGKVNRPTLFRGAGAAIFQFKGFTVNFMEMLYKMAAMQGPEGKRALAYVAGGLVMSAGVFGLPFADDLKELVEALYKGLTDEELDIEKEIRDISYELSGSPLVGEMVARGPLRMTGADLSRRLGMGSILPTDTIVALFGGDSNKAGEVFGIPLDLTIGKATRAWNYAKLDQPGMAAAELLPTFIKNPIHATAWGSYGVRSTSSGRMQTRPDEVDGLEVMLKAIGFTPTTITREREAEWAKTRVGRAVTDLQARYNTRLARAIVEGDRDEVLIIRDEIEEHNSENPLHRRIIISPSTMKARIRQEVLGSASRHHPRKARSEALRVDEIYPAKEAG